MARQKQKKTNKRRPAPVAKLKAPLDIGKHLNRAVKLHKNGKLDDARATYQKILRHHPDHFDALQLLGVLDLGLERYSSAVRLISRAIAQRPDLPALHCNLGIARMHQQQPEQAIESLRQALELDENFTLAHFHLGKILLNAHLSSEALAHLRAADRLRPGHWETRVLLALALSLSGELDSAQAYLEKSFTEQGELADAYRHSGAQLRSRKRWNDALHFFKLAHALQSDDTDTLVNIAELLERGNHLVEARAFIEPYLNGKPAPIALTVIAVRVERRLGALERARQLAEQAIHIVDDSDAGAALFSEYGYTLESLGQYTPAWEAVTSANKILSGMADAAAISRDAIPELIDECRTWAHVQQSSQVPAIAPRHQPRVVFFCGFPRSGTTLVERILDRHPDIITTQETPALSNTALAMGTLLGEQISFPNCLGQLNEVQIDKLRAAYLLQLGVGDDEKRLIVDKMPLNTWFLPLALRMFPKAQVLFAIRNPRDVCLSCYFQDFELNESMVHFLDIKQCAQLYDRSMHLWKLYQDALHPDCLEFRYEDLVRDPSEMVTRIVKFLGMNLIENMHEVQAGESERMVFTPSYEAIIKPINDSAVGRWTRYRHQLEPVREILDPWAVRYGYSEV